MFNIHKQSVFYRNFLIDGCKKFFIILFVNQTIPLGFPKAKEKKISKK
jgi:hypothetical protein